MSRYGDLDSLATKWTIASPTQRQNFKQIIEEHPTADVVPKSEVDNWYQLYHSIKEELKQEKIYHRETEKLCDRYCIESQQAKKQVAREIFEEIDEMLDDIMVVANPNDCFITTFRKTMEKVTAGVAELKKKYTGEET